ncbi:MAG: hypothetical protein Q8L47_04915, partial [bacterium]|nr:hypothetical protein [bacterium]
TITTTVNGGTFKATWNKVNFKWDTATKTGSPDSSDLVYFDIIINYSSSMTDANNIRVDQIKIFEPEEMELVYFSKYMVTKSGTLQQYFTTSTIDTAEILILPDQHFNLFVNLALSMLFPQKEKNNNDYLRIKEEIKEQLPLAILESGNAITREDYEFSIEGGSASRDDVSNGQW